MLHADEYNRPTLVFDMIEPYRHWAEWIASQAVHRKYAARRCFRGQRAEGYWLGSFTPGRASSSTPS
ncbi:MAG: CRISPR-associated endonuclease Cas1 [Lewinellaceae bacterium]|nr:CRISPR-associated endonuclease Cas1 [Lewinellaceae bacterium]